MTEWCFRSKRAELNLVERQRTKDKKDVRYALLPVSTNHRVTYL